MSKKGSVKKMGKVKLHTYRFFMDRMGVPKRKKIKEKFKKELSSTEEIKLLDQEATNFTDLKYKRYIHRRQIYYLQNESCAICKKHYNYKQLFLDHDHATLEERGLVCPTCNTMLGFYEKMVRDSNLYKAVKEYLKIKE